MGEILNFSSFSRYSFFQLSPSKMFSQEKRSPHCGLIQKLLTTTHQPKKHAKRELGATHRKVRELTSLAKESCKGVNVKISKLGNKARVGMKLTSIQPPRLLMP